MNDRIKTLGSATVLALLGLAIVPEAGAGSVPATRGTSAPIQACVAEIGKYADYGGASRVVHAVAALDQRNLVEMEIKVETSVYTKDGAVAREYTASCVTGSLGKLLKFHIDGVV
jgi:hypothetical protein